MKIKPFHLSLIIATTIFLLAVLATKDFVVYQVIEHKGHSDCFRVAETNDIRTVLTEIQKLDYIDQAWIKSSSIVFSGKNLAGQIFHLDGTNTQFTGYGITVVEVPPNLTRERVEVDIGNIMDRTKR